MTITSEIQIVVEATISEGKVDALKKLAQETLDVVKAKDPGTLAYQFYFNNDESKVYFLERYKDSQSFLSHMENTIPHQQKLRELATITRIEVFGNPSPDLEKTLSSFGARFFKYWNGFIR